MLTKKPKRGRSKRRERGPVRHFVPDDMDMGLSDIIYIDPWGSEAQVIGPGTDEGP